MGRVENASTDGPVRRSIDAVQLVQVKPDTWVANMVGQRGIRTGSNGPPVRYEAIECCLATLAEHAKRLEASVHMPSIGCGLAGGKWERIAPRIADTLLKQDIATTVYDFDLHQSDTAKTAHFSTDDGVGKQSIPQWLICENRFEERNDRSSFHVRRSARTEAIRRRDRPLTQPASPHSGYGDSGG